MIKVLLAAPKGNISGGIARWTEHVLNYYHNIDNPSIQLLFYNTARKKQSPEGLFKRLFRGFIEYSTLIRGLLNTIHNNDINVMHFTSSASLGLFRDVIFIKIASYNNIRTVVHFRFGRTPNIVSNKNWEYYLLRYVVSIVNVAIFIDKSSYNAMQGLGFKNLQLLPNPISPTVETLVNRIGAKVRIPQSVLFVGHCYKDKGVYELVEACRTIPNLKLKLVGSIRDNIKQELLYKGAGFIEITGEEEYERIIEDMLICDIFVLPSYTEGFPNVILEAMACGCCIIATEVGAIPEMLDINCDCKCGIVIPPKSSAEIKRALSNILYDEQMKEKYRKLAARRVREQYAMSVIWKQMESIWMKIE